MNRQRLRNALIVMLSLLLAGVMGEFTVRLAQQELDPTRHLRFIKGSGDVPILGPANTHQRQIKNTGDFNVSIRFNRLGFRESKDVIRSTADDIFLVGDSFTFGWGVEESERISERLESLIGRRVFNISMPTGFNGYDRLLRYVVAQGATVRNVIIAVSMETDIQLYEGDTPATDGVAERPRPGLDLLRIKSFLTQNSALYLLTTTLFHRYPPIRELAVNFGLLTPNLEGIRLFEISAEVIESSAQRLADIAKRYQTTIVVLPSRAMWIGDHQDSEKERHRLFVSRLRQLGMAVVDLRPTFEAKGNPLSYHFANDPHWNPAGHARAAEALAAHIKARNTDP